MFALALCALTVYAVYRAVRWARRADKDELDIDRATLKELTRKAKFLERFYKDSPND